MCEGHKTLPVTINELEDLQDKHATKLFFIVSAHFTLGLGNLQIT